MSTRSTTHFVDSSEGAIDAYKPAAIIYRHSDGYPEGAGVDIKRFLAEVKRDVPDNRFTDPNYLAAKYVVFLAREFSVDYKWDGATHTKTPKASRLDFLSVGIMSEDAGDIDYRYTIDCGKIDSKGFPTVTCYSLVKEKNVRIPAIPKEEAA